MSKDENDIFIPNSADQLHCTQAALIMAFARLTGEVLSMREAEMATGYRPDVETWPYTMIAWLAENGVQVHHIDALHPLNFLESPKKTLEDAGYDSATVNYFMSITDFAKEADSIDRALRTNRVRFECRVPSMDDITMGLNSEWLPILSLDATTLTGSAPSADFDGHVVVATDADSQRVQLQDPGPPPMKDWWVQKQKVSAALKRPVDESGTVTLLATTTHREGL